VDDLQRVSKAEPLDDLRPDWRRRGFGEGAHRRMPELLDHGAQPQIVRAEVVTPGGDAMGLVDDEQASRPLTWSR